MHSEPILKAAERPTPERIAAAGIAVFIARELVLDAIGIAEELGERRQPHLHPSPLQPTDEILVGAVVQTDIELANDTDQGPLFLTARDSGKLFLRAPEEIPEALQVPPREDGKLPCEALDQIAMRLDLSAQLFDYRLKRASASPGFFS